ncbi:hypothetical protein LMG7141_03306 [Ralstonia condita]|uniref:Transmembrane protein n=1 Tax=Ralstonia condita TaxID=3058600 RepID=A0ABN9J6H6_9RALS|nr:hypothetical protein [Ralstonia sp. LMG 7141]CAJ0796911.1 hypothetical protein LMG7141_03306 [Ralstonia sp. LMG 7141]
MTDFIDFMRTWAVAHAELLLAWLTAALVVTSVAWIEIRRATRRAAIAMTEAVATTVAACVPEIAAAAQSAHPGLRASGSGSSLAEAMCALTELSTERMQWLQAVANLRLAEAVLPTVVPVAPVHPLIYDTPRPLAEAHLAAERRFTDHARALLAERRSLQALETAEREGTRELLRIERETSAIVERFEQANAQSEQTEVQRFLIQKFHALGNRERELTAQLAALRQQIGERAEALWAQSHGAAENYASMLVPLLAVARHALGHETTVDETMHWLAHTRTGERPFPPA